MRSIVGLTSVLTSDQLSKMDSFGLTFNQAMRDLYVDLCIKKISVNALSPIYQQKYSISKRHFNSIRIILEGKVSSILKLNENYIVDTKYDIQRLTTTLKRERKNYEVFTKQLKTEHTLDNKDSMLKTSLFKKIKYNQIRLDRLKAKLKRLLKMKTDGDSGLCFGSNKLFRKQFQVGKKNNLTPFKTHEQWYEEWHYQRNKDFCLVGSKDETAGNVNAQITHIKDNEFNLKLNLHHQAKPADKFINIQFTVQHEVETLKQIIINNQSKDNELWQALTYRLTKQNSWSNAEHKQNKYTVAISFEKHLKKKNYTSKDKGCLGVDINQDHLAVSNLNQQGQLLDIHTFKYELNGSKHQNNNDISLAVKGLMALSLKLNKPLVIEELDFKEKKRTMTSGVYKSRNRQLSSFAYSKIIELIKARAEDNFIEVKEVNPAYTSVIGFVKYSIRNKIDTHHAAAMCIGRKGLNYEEKRISNSNKHIKVSCLPERNDLKTDAYWIELKNNLLKQIQHERGLRRDKRKLKKVQSKELRKLSASLITNVAV